MKLNLDQVEHVAQLARLALSDREKELFRAQLSSILDHAERLQELDTEDIPLTASVLPLSNVMREDAIGASLPQEDALANAPEVEAGFFRVPVVLEGEE